MDAYRLSKRAHHDLAEILRYTIKTWGPQQAATYLDLINAARIRIMNNPALPGSKARRDLADDCRAFRAGKHVIFYRVNHGALEIARILHESMDFEQHLDPSDFD